MSGDLKSSLEAEVARFKYMYPNSSIRFAQIIGKRVSHIAGPVDDIFVGEKRVRVNDGLVMFVNDADGIGPEQLERFAVQVAAVVG